MTAGAAARPGAPQAIEPYLAQVAGALPGAARARADIVADSGARAAPVYALGAPLEQTYAGLKRYWSKRDGES